VTFGILISHSTLPITYTLEDFTNIRFLHTYCSPPYRCKLFIYMALEVKDLPYFDDDDDDGNNNNSVRATDNFYAMHFCVFAPNPPKNPHRLILCN
jgi:hypothetical protein